MKKLYTYAACIGMAFAANTMIAQKNLPGPVLPSGKISDEGVKLRHNNAGKAQVGEWLFFDDAYFNIVSSADITQGFVNFLFPDSTILTNPTDPFPTWTHAVGQAYDLTSPAWTFTNDIDYTQPVKIDSILVWGFYNRVNSSVDTLDLNLYVPSSTGNLWDVYLFAGVQATLGVDTAFFADMSYNFATNTIDAPTWSHKIILDQAFFADSTADGLHEHVVVPNNLTMTLNPGDYRQGVFGFSLEFLPGYTHNPNVDIIGVDQNGYRPIAAELNGDATTPTIVEKNDLTVSYLLERDVRYNLDPNWNGHVIPGIAYTAPFNWEYIYIVPFISQSNTLSVDPNETTSNFGIYPNPANELANVSFSSTVSGDASISVYDLSGKLVKQFSNLAVQQGANTYNLNVAELNSGTYITTLVSNGYKSTTRLVVAR